MKSGKSYRDFWQTNQMDSCFVRRFPNFGRRREIRVNRLPSALYSATGVNFSRVVRCIGYQNVAQIRHGGARASFLTILKGTTYWLRYPDRYGTGGYRS